MVWEIKPIGSTAGGVLQEARYRILFNLVRLLLRCLHLPHPSHPIRPGMEARYATGMVVDLTDILGEPSFAYPFQILPELDGVVLYIVFRAFEDATTATTLFAILQRLLEQWRREQEESEHEDDPGGGGRVPVPVRREAPEINWSMVTIVVIVLIIIVLVLAAIAGASAAVIAAILAALGALAGGTPVIPVAPTEDFNDGLAAAWGLADDVLNIQFSPAPGRDPTRDPVQVKFAGLRIAGLPKERVVPLLDYFGAAVPGARSIFQHYLIRQLRSRPGTSVGVS
jgi:hypothetical protein